MANQKKNQVKRNERERKRVHQVNDGFDLLRTRLRPAAAANKKLSKADTLREAVKYIRHLQQLLGQEISLPSTPPTTNFYQEKGEFDAYFPSPPPQHAQHLPPQHVAPTQHAQQLQYTSPTSSMPSYSPPQLYYSTAYHQAQ